jgi:hypothetical protein
MKNLRLHDAKDLDIQPAKAKGMERQNGGAIQTMVPNLTDWLKPELIDSLKADESATSDVIKSKKLNRDCWERCCCDFC